MKIAILSNHIRYGTRRFTEEATKRGYRIKVYKPKDLVVALKNSKPMLYHKTTFRRIPTPNILLTRIGSLADEYALNIANQFEMMGIRVVNNPKAIQRARNKLLCLQMFNHAGIKTPKTIVVKKPKQVDKAVEFVGGYPVIMKFFRGSLGIGVMLAESSKSAKATLEAWWKVGYDIIIQEFIKESEGKDIRAFVVGDKVIGAMRRESLTSDFRANIHRGGIGKLIALTKTTEELAIKTAQTIGLEITGVDLLGSRKGAKVIEVNACPGFQGLEEATDVDVAKEVIDYIERG